MFPERKGNFTSVSNLGAHAQQRLEKFNGGRTPVFYDEQVRCDVVWCGVVWCGVVWCGVVWCGVVWCGVVWCGVVW